MRPSGVAEPSDPPDAIVVRGRDPALLAAAVRRLLPPAPLPGAAVVLVRLSPPTPASSTVVHVVVDALVEAGCEVTVAGLLASRDRDRGHRDVGALAHAAGLTGRTARGRSYAVIDLAEDLVPSLAPATSALAGQPVSTAWLTAGTRVVVGRAVTDLVDTYAGCLDTLLRAVPEVAGCEPADVAVEVARHLRPHLAVLDALSTSGGADGSRLPDETETDTVVVARDPVLADVTLAGLLGVDRSSSSLVERAVAAIGAPAGSVEGDLRPFGAVAHAHPLAVRAARRVARDLRLARVLSAATGGPDAGSVPADPVLAALRPVVTEAVRAATDPVGQAGLVGLLGLAATVAAGGEAWGATMDKSTVERRVVSLGFDPAAHPDDDYDGLPEQLAAVDAVIDRLPVSDDPEALRWCLVDGATVFEVRRLVPADFDAWVERVDVAEGISLMADYVGGRRVPVGDPVVADGGGDTRQRQAERNLYLPQPNYLAAWGGEPIDVCKIELVERGPDRHRLLWRTVSSPNGSAVHDDGTLTFERAGATGPDGGDGPDGGAGTMVTIRGRQLFTLPAALDAVDLPSVPELHRPLLEEAYRRFFTATFDNLEACFEGREHRIGRPPPDPSGPLLTESVRMVVDGLTARLVGDVAGSSVRSPAPDPALDQHGFRHVRGSRPGPRRAVPPDPEVAGP
ncbi:hypothetical protein GCM10009868_26120 [Terrabacter aerolatus]|uniref:Uncharacterized protein n=2 Tax=Terrabacter aerolatus TaxID=422442 RepID=A0A512D592_9MICO|nr:hypothetical protein [Terrabacter aerolatus]GEO31627.1 hypothetical protein TAE01_34370 [Terrabacter aerolatus]